MLGISQESLGECPETAGRVSGSAGECWRVTGEPWIGGVVGGRSGVGVGGGRKRVGGRGEGEEGNGVCACVCAAGLRLAWCLRSSVLKSPRDGRGVRVSTTD